jgi:hypothetical protein
LGQTRAIVEWEEQGTGRISVQEDKLVLPIVAGVEESSPIGLSVRTPSSPGRYLLRLHFPSHNSDPASLSIELTKESFLTSLNAPHLLSAAYTLEDRRPPAITSEFINVTLRAMNTGKNVWLARAKGGRGEVRLGWRWFRGDQVIPVIPERTQLTYDVFPGQTYEFKARIPSPSEPGHYILELGLVSELITWFFDRGIEPVKIAVHVH